MAQKRMFDRGIVSSDSFTEMSSDAQSLYFHLGIHADDEGFVSPKGIMRMISAPEDSLKVLVAKNFVIPFKSGVVVITDWNDNNFLDSRRIKPTQFQEERKQLILTDNKKYEFSIGLASAKHPLNQSSVVESSIEENRIGENRISIIKKNFDVFWSLYPRKIEKKKSELKWYKLKPNVQALILEDIPRRKKGRKWSAGYIENPTTYLNGERWNDEVEVEITKSNSIKI